MNKRRFTISVTLVGAIAALSIGTAWATGIIGGQEPRALTVQLKASDVTEVRAAARSQSGRAYVAEAQQGGEPVVAIAIGDTVTPWGRRVDLFRESPLVVTAGASGGQGQVESLSVAGFASPTVRRLIVQRADGSTQELSVTDGAFAADLDPLLGSAAVVAYSSAGIELARQELAAPIAP